MIILAIDPGSEQSAWVRYDNEQHIPLTFDVFPNMQLREYLHGDFSAANHLAIEYMYPRGQPTSLDELRTQFWAGRFVEAWGGEWSRIYRHKVKMHICGRSSGVSDSNIRRALIDNFGGDSKAVGGKKCPKCKGKKWVGRDHADCDECHKTGWLYPPGPFYKIKGNDLWSAVAIAVTYSAVGESVARLDEPKLTPGPDLNERNNPKAPIESKEDKW